MFRNPGGSLKTYGKIVFFIFAIAAVTGGIMMFVGAGNAGRYSGGAAFGMVIGGIILIAVGIFVAYLLAVFVIAFGELVENSTMIRKMMENGNTVPNISRHTFNAQPEVHQSVQSKPEKTVDLHKDSDTVAICPFCGKDNKIDANFCRNCGKKIG